MSLFWIALVAIGTVAFVALPRIAFVLVLGRSPTQAGALQWVAAFLFGVSWLLPNPRIDQTDTFSQHAVGGGAACACLAYWLAQNARVQSSAARLALAYVVTAALGAGVELVELASDEFLSTRLTHDTPWDLLANTSGALLMGFLFEASRWHRARRGSS